MSLATLPETKENGLFYKRYPHYFTEKSVSFCIASLEEQAQSDGYLGLKVVRDIRFSCGCRELTFKLI